MVLLVLLPGCGGKSSEETEPIDDLGPVGSFTFTERHGKKISDADLRGKVWVASFVFTRCNMSCPQVTATMARLQKELNIAEHDDLRFVTFTVDPERDQPKDLIEYADRYRAHRDRWLFLTGDQEKLYDLIREGFHLGVAEKRPSEKKPGDEFTHSDRLVVVDKRGHIRGYFEGLPHTIAPDATKTYEENLKKLVKTVETLLAEETP